MVFIVPVKRVTYTRMKRFSQYVDIDSSPLFVLQKRKSAKSSSGRPNYRILTKGHTYYELAYANDLNQMREREWKYVTEALPRAMPPNMDEKTQLVWIIAHISCRAIDIDGARDQTGSVDIDRIEAQRRGNDAYAHGSDDDDDGGNGQHHHHHHSGAAPGNASPTAPTPAAAANAVPAAPTAANAAAAAGSNPGNVTPSSLSSPASSGAGGAAPAGGAAGANAGAAAAAANAAAAAAAAAPTAAAAAAAAARGGSIKAGALPGIIVAPKSGNGKLGAGLVKLPRGDALVPVTTWPLRGIVAFLLLIAATNMPALLMREATPKTFLATLAVLNIILFLLAIVGVPATLGLTILQPASALAANGHTVLHSAARALLMGELPCQQTGAAAAGASAGNGITNSGYGDGASTGDGSDDAYSPPSSHYGTRQRRGSTTASEGESSGGGDSSNDDDDGATGGGNPHGGLSSNSNSAVSSLSTGGLVAGANNAGKATNVSAAGITPGCSMKASSGPGDVSAYSDPQGESWPVRCGPNYKKNKKKAPSAPSLFNLVGMDVFRSEKKIIHASKHINMDEIRNMKPAPYVSLGGKIDQVRSKLKQYCICLTEIAHLDMQPNIGDLN
mgnify:CR=1 FL=1